VAWKTTTSPNRLNRQTVKRECYFVCSTVMVAKRWPSIARNASLRFS
jgi:hypothetical protein